MSVADGELEKNGATTRIDAWPDDLRGGVMPTIKKINHYGLTFYSQSLALGYDVLFLYDVFPLIIYFFLDYNSRIG